MTLLLAFYLLDVDSDLYISQKRYIPSLRGAMVSKRPWHLSYYLRATYFPHVQGLIHPPHHQLVYFAPRSRVAFATVPQRLESRIQR